MKKLSALIAGLLTGICLLAQPTVRVEVHNIVELSEQFNLVFIVEGEHSPSDFVWNPGDDFTVVWGPQKGTSTSIQIINGKTNRSSQTSYTYILQPRKTGAFTIAPATATIKGKEYSSSPVSIKVVDNGSARQNSQASASQTDGSSAQASSTQADSDIFMRLSTSRSNVVVGEPVTVTLKIYHRANLVGFENAKFPSFKGFWSQETESPSNLEFQREEVNGAVYNSALIRRWVIIPQKAGDVSIDPAEVVCLVNVRRRRTGGSSIFDDFFGSDYATVRQRVYTTSPTLHVSPLPAGAPASFCGGVGEFSIKARVSKDTLKTHDAASLTVTVSGKGNIALLEAPKINFPPDFEVYDMKSSTGASASATSGTRTFEYPFIPRSPGDFVLPPVKYAYYDIKARKYQIASTDSLHLTVLRSGNAVASSSNEPAAGQLTVERKGVRSLGDDIRFIRTRTQLGQASSFLVYSPLWWGIIGLIILAGAGFWLGMRKIAARRADVAGTLSRKATKQALRRLAQAREFLQKNLYTAFYEELHRSLLGFISDKLTMDMAELSKDNIAAQLASREVPQNLIDDFVQLLDDCEFARYAPDSGHEAMSAHYQKAVTAITAIDSSMKKAPSAKPLAIIALLLALAPANAFGAPQSYPDSLWNSGVNAYMEGNYNQAVKDWEAVRSTGLFSRELYYNLGNAYFKSGEIAPAILWYERALRLDPSDADVRYNLEYARSMTQDRIEEIPEFFLEQWGRAACYLLPSNTWAVISLVMLAVAVALALLFLLGSTPGRRRAGFFGGIAALLIALLGWDFAQWQRTEALRQDYAIVTKAVSAVKSAPSGEGAKDLFILHEGTRVKILDNVSGFSSVELADGRKGWLPSRDIEVI